MKPGYIFIRHNFSAIAQKVIAVWFDHDAPLAEIGREVLPHPNVEGSLTIDDLDPIMHDVQFWQSADGISLDSHLLTLNTDASKKDIYAIEEYYYVVDRGQSGVVPGEEWSDPINNTIELRDARLKDKSYIPFFRGETFRLPGNWIDRSDDGGGFDLVANVWAPGEEIMVLVNNIQTVSTSSSSVSESFSDIKIVAADAVFDNTFYKRSILIDSVLKVITIDFDPLATIPSTRARFITHTGTQNNLILQFSAGETVRFRGEDVNKVILGRGEVVELFIKNSVCYIVDAHGDWDKVGQRFFVDVVGLNQLKLDGTEYQISEYPRVEDFVTKLGAGQVVTSLATWELAQVIDYVKEGATVLETKTVYPNKHKWLYDEINGVFRPPDDRNMHYRALKTFDGVADTERIGSNVAGAYQVDAFKGHTHGYDKPKNQSNSDSGGTPDKVTTEAGRTSSVGGSETRGENVGQIAVVGI